MRHVNRSGKDNPKMKRFFGKHSTRAINSGRTKRWFKGERGLGRRDGS